MSEKPHNRLRRLEGELIALAPPIDPPALHWLNSDATFSYCWNCAIVARGREFELGPLLVVSRWHPDEWERRFFEGIDGGFDGAPSDHPERCEICGCTLRHTLSDYGVAEEITHYLAHPAAAVSAEQAYAIERICLNLTWAGADAAEVGGAISIVEAALATARQAVSA